MTLVSNMRRIDLNGHILASIDFETTGTQPGYHEICEIGILPVGDDLETTFKPFHCYLRPDFPERASSTAMLVNQLDMQTLLDFGLPQEYAKDRFRDWFDRLNLSAGKKLVPLAHKCEFESAFLDSWLGTSGKYAYFRADARDAYKFAIMINDLAAARGEKPPIKSYSLTKLCNQFGIPFSGEHRALNDAKFEIDVYRHLCELANHQGSSGERSE